MHAGKVNAIKDILHAWLPSATGASVASSAKVFGMEPGEATSPRPTRSGLFPPGEPPQPVPLPASPPPPAAGPDAPRSPAPPLEAELPPPLEGPASPPPGPPDSSPRPGHMVEVPTGHLPPPPPQGPPPGSPPRRVTSPEGSPPPHVAGSSSAARNADERRARLATKRGGAVAPSGVQSTVRYDRAPRYETSNQFGTPRTLFYDDLQPPLHSKTLGRRGRRGAVGQALEVHQVSDGQAAGPSVGAGWDPKEHSGLWQATLDLTQSLNERGFRALRSILRPFGPTQGRHEFD